MSVSLRPAIEKASQKRKRVVGAPKGAWQTFPPAITVIYRFELSLRLCYCRSVGMLSCRHLNSPDEHLNVRDVRRIRYPRVAVPFKFGGSLPYTNVIVDVFIKTYVRARAGRFVLVPYSSQLFYHRAEKFEYPCPPRDRDGLSRRAAYPWRRYGHRQRVDVQ
jgi:hypothetical protein